MGMRDKLDELMNIRKAMAVQALQLKTELREKKRHEKIVRWQQVK
jgi:hypothetical protein